MVERDVQARLLAYKAYRIGRDSTLQRRTDRDAEIARSCISQLATAESDQTLRRRLFYTLIRAEIHRKSDPVPDRIAAKEIGERLRANGCVDPFELYMKIIEETTNTMNTGNYGDMTAKGNSLVRDFESYIDRFGNEIHIDKAAVAVGLSNTELKRHGTFLSLSLEEITRLHNLEP